MPGRMPFTFNTMVLLPFLRSLPASGAVSVLATVVAMTGLDFGAMALGRPETAADVTVAWMMSFSVAAPVCWVVYMIVNAWEWTTRFIRSRREGQKSFRLRNAPSAQRAEGD